MAHLFLKLPFSLSSPEERHPDHQRSPGFDGLRSDRVRQDSRLPVAHLPQHPRGWTWRLWRGYLVLFS